MANALTRFFRRDEPQALRQRIDDLQRERSQILAKIDTASQAKRQNAFEARGGNTDAQKILDRTNAHLSELRLELDDVDAAIADGRRRLADAEAAEAAEALKAKGERMRQLMAGRIAAARDADQAMIALADAIRRLRDGGQEMRKLCRELLAVQGAGGRHYDSDLDTFSVDGRAMEIGARHGLHEMLGYERKVGSLRQGPDTLAAAETVVHRRYETLSDGRLRIIAEERAAVADDKAGPARPQEILS